MVVRFPSANTISNGQRDILTFVSMLFRAKKHLKKDVNILIIDEVFDYLDDANLIAAQYYITKFIDDFKAQGKRMYPLILTHLDPVYFRNYAFSKQKVYYLDRTDINVNPNLSRLIRNRENDIIREDVSRCLFHYHPDNINRRAEFVELGIRPDWGEERNFYDYLDTQVRNYLDGNIYDPFAVCGAVRIMVEEIAYRQLEQQDSRDAFIATHKTRSKLEKAEEMGVHTISETFYLLGVIYNDGMHWRENADNITPIIKKLDNLVIKNLIEKVVAEHSDN